MPESTAATQSTPTPRACTTCGGQRGYPETTPTLSGHTTVFRTCQGCGGTGIQNGGI